ncbi:MAG TPA: hypothetical protein VGQ57_09175 [Polyangiaceae bacterium]|jgi:hypothetical protein|nr:hypothetical protein [Polyangiaceae bacterium]
MARQAVIAAEKLTQARSQLLDLEAGGTPERPLEVATSSVIEPKARSVHCPRCDEPFDVTTHEVEATRHGRLRRATVQCRQCGGTRSLWFRVIAPS